MKGKRSGGSQQCAPAHFCPGADCVRRRLPERRVPQAAPRCRRWPRAAGVGCLFTCWPRPRCQGRCLLRLPQLRCGQGRGRARTHSCCCCRRHCRRMRRQGLCRKQGGGCRVCPPKQHVRPWRQRLCRVTARCCRRHCCCSSCRCGDGRWASPVRQRGAGGGAVTGLRVSAAARAARGCAGTACWAGGHSSQAGCSGRCLSLLRLALQAGQHALAAQDGQGCGAHSQHRGPHHCSAQLQG